jgi:hypothetical protein
MSADFTAHLRAPYGDRIERLVLFGSRAHGARGFRLGHRGVFRGSGRSLEVSGQGAEHTQKNSRGCQYGVEAKLGFRETVLFLKWPFLFDFHPHERLIHDPV